MDVSNYLISAIRTYVPIVIGSALAFVALHFGIVVDDGTEAALAVPLTGVLIAAYWSLVRLLERKWPRLGVFLGVAAKPVYESAAGRMKRLGAAKG